MLTTCGLSLYQPSALCGGPFGSSRLLGLGAPIPGRGAVRSMRICTLELGRAEKVPTHVFGGSVGDADGCSSTVTQVPALGPDWVTSAITRFTPPLPTPGSVTVAVIVTVCPVTSEDDDRTSGAILSGS